MKKAIALLLVLILSMALLSACGGGGDEFKGTWKGEDSNTSEVTFVFDGKGGLKYTGPFARNEAGTYTITGSKVEISVSTWDSVRSYTFSIKDNKMTLTAPEDQYYVGFDLAKK